jgi:hypothetical protein
MVFIDLVISSSFESRSALEQNRAACGVGFTARQEVTTGVDLFLEPYEDQKPEVARRDYRDNRRSAVKRGPAAGGVRPVKTLALAVGWKPGVLLPICYG